MVTLDKKGKVPEIRTIDLKPIRDMKKIRGKFEELINAANRIDDYVQITLTDEDDVANAMSRLQVVYKNALELKYDNARTRANATILSADGVESKTAFELFSEFFIDRNNSEMSEKQREYMKALIEKIEGEEA